MPLHCTMVDAGRQIGGYPIRQYKPPPYPPFLWTNQAAIRQDVETPGHRSDQVKSKFAARTYRTVPWQADVDRGKADLAVVPI